MDDFYFYSFWLDAWVIASAAGWTILCCLSMGGLDLILRFVGPPTVLVVTSALLGWSFRSDAFDAFLVPVLVFCSSLLVTAGMLLAFRRLDRGRRALRWIAGLGIAAYTVVQAAVCALFMSFHFVSSVIALEGELSAGRLEDGYFYRQHTSGFAFTSTSLDTTVYWVPPLLPFLERPVARSHVAVDPLPATPRSTGGRGERRLVVLYKGSPVDELFY